MKHYPKIYEDLYRQRKELSSTEIESALGSVDDLTLMFREFFVDTYRELFRSAMRYLWLEKQIVYKGKRRMRRFRNGHIPDAIFSRFMSAEVGHDQATLTRSRWFQVLVSCVVELFPHFFKYSPFENPEMYEWPYEHVTIDFFAFVYQVENRFELLDFAEEKRMSYLDFKNWATNYVLSYNDDKGEEKYALSLANDLSPYIKRAGWDYSANADNLAQLLDHE